MTGNMHLFDYAYKLASTEVQAGIARQCVFVGETNRVQVSLQSDGVFFAGYQAGLLDCQLGMHHNDSSNALQVALQLQVFQP